jgi:hypothetical protein
MYYSQTDRPSSRVFLSSVTSRLFCTQPTEIYLHVFLEFRKPEGLSGEAGLFVRVPSAFIFLLLMNILAKLSVDKLYQFSPFTVIFHFLFCMTFNIMWVGETSSPLSLCENPERSHEGGEDPGQGSGPLHQNVHTGVVHVLADGGASSLEKKAQEFSHLYF